MRKLVYVFVLGSGLLVGGAVRGVEPPSVFGVTPSVHFNGAVGVSSSEEVDELGVGHHDPTREAGSVQGLELGASLRTGAYLEGFATYTLHYGASEEWEGEWEEAFLKLVDLPGGAELRGGRMLARYGAFNATHMHGWDFVDLPLVAGLLLGEDGLLFDGGDISWIQRDRLLTYGAIVGYGEVLSHDHGDHDEEEDHDAEEDHETEEEGREEDGHDDHAGHQGGHGGWADGVGYGRLFALYRSSDFRQWTVGVSSAFGDNAEAHMRTVLGLDLTYQWRENGLAAGGRALRWTTELMGKIETFTLEAEADHGEHDDDELAEHDVHGEAEEETTLGAYSQAVYSWNAKWDTGLRVGVVEREGERGSRFRVSPALTWRPLGGPDAALRLQYNFDEIASEREHTVWAQVGLSWGGGEVR